MQGSNKEGENAFIQPDGGKYYEYKSVLTAHMHN